jgi:uroporphyrinogen-III synthase
MVKKEIIRGKDGAELAILHKIIETISYDLNLEEVLSNIINIVDDVTKADSCFLYLVDGKDLVMRASQNSHPGIVGNIKLKLGEGITGWVAKNKKIVIVSKKAYEDERFKLFNNLPEDAYESFLSVPIIYKKVTLGVINVQHKNPRKYSDSEIKLFETIARAVGGAVENARLFTESHELREALETRKIIEKAKGILMKEMSISEDDAYKLLNKKSMDKRISMKEVAEAIMISDELKRGT